MSAWSCYTAAGSLIATPSKPPQYGFEGGRNKLIVASASLGGQIRSESRGPDLRTMRLQWTRLPLADLHALDALHAQYGGGAAAFRVELPDGALAGVVGGALVPVRWLDPRLRYRWVGDGRYDVTMDLVEDVTSRLASGTLTQDVRLSLVAGTAFACPPTLDLSGYVGDYLVLTDSRGHRCAGWIKAAGTTQTYGSNLVTNPTFDSNTDNWTPYYGTLASVAGGYSGNALEITRTEGTAQIARQIMSGLSVGSFYRAYVRIKSGSSGDNTCSIRVYPGVLSGWIIDSGASTSSWVVYQVYLTAESVTATMDLRKDTSTAGTMLFDTAYFAQVVTPPATGATIVSSRDGTTYNWALQETRFNANDAAGYQYAIYDY